MNKSIFSFGYRDGIIKLIQLFYDDIFIDINQIGNIIYYGSNSSGTIFYGTNRNIARKGNSIFEYDLSNKIIKIDSINIDYNTKLNVAKLSNDHVEYNDMGNITKIGNIVILYDTSSRVCNIGDASISYDNTSKNLNYIGNSTISNLIIIPIF